MGRPELTAADIRETVVHRTTISEKVAQKAILAAARVTGVRPEQIRGPRRRANIVAARHIAMWLMRRLEPKASIGAIGRALRGRHYSTVMHAIRKLERATGGLAELRDEALRLAEAPPQQPQQAILLDVDHACSALEALIEDLRCIRDRLRAMADGKTDRDEYGAGDYQALQCGDRVTLPCPGSCRSDHSGDASRTGLGKAYVRQ